MLVDQLVGSLGIEGVGRRMVKVLVDAGYDDLNKLALTTVPELARVEGFGLVRAQAFRDGFDTRKSLILDILAAGVKIVKPEVKAPTSNQLVGQSFCFTGFRDKGLEEAIQMKGGEIKSGVGKGLTFLVCKSLDSGSSKAEKARSLGTKVISGDDLRKMLTE